MKKNPANLLIGFGSVAIIVGGLFSAFTAHHASYVSAWAVAYTVLIVGVVQILLGLGAERLAKHRLVSRDIIVAFAIFNIGNAAVITGTIIKYTTDQNTLLVGTGGALIAVAMLNFSRLVRGAPKSNWLIAYFCLVGIVFVSMLVGLMLSAQN